MTWDNTMLDTALGNQPVVYEGTYKTSGSEYTLTFDGISKAETMTVSGDKITWVMSGSRDKIVLQKTDPAAKPAYQDLKYDFYAVAASVKPITYTKLLENYALTAAERRMYDQLVEGIANFEVEIEVDHFNPNDSADWLTMAKVEGIVYYTHPEFFWFRIGGFSAKPLASGRYAVYPFYYMDNECVRAIPYNSGNVDYPPAEKVAELKAWVEKSKAEIDEALKKVPVYLGMTPFELELAVHDWLCDIADYQEAYASGGTIATATNIHGALTKGKINCMGYSSTFQYIMNMLGVETVQMDSDMPNDDTGHTFNAVKLGGAWYYVDVTNDDHIGELYNAPSVTGHYFLNCTEKFYADHILTVYTPYDCNPNISCTSVTYYYYVVTNTLIASDADLASSLPARITRAYTHKEKGFDLLINPSYAKASAIGDKLVSFGVPKSGSLYTVGLDNGLTVKLRPYVDDARNAVLFVIDYS